jgi:hypothetical protein
MDLNIGQIWVSNKRVKYTVLQRVQHVKTKTHFWKLKSGSIIEYCTLDGELVGKLGKEKLLMRIAFKKPKVVKNKKVEISPEEQREAKLKDMKAHNDKIIKQLKLKKGK